MLEDLRLIQGSNSIIHKPFLVKPKVDMAQRRGSSVLDYLQSGGLPQ